MRKEVKIGTAIGGVLVAVLVVSALVNKGHSKKTNAVALDLGKSSATGDQTGAADRSAAGDPDTTAHTGDPAPVPHDTAGDVQPGGPVTPPAGGPSHSDDADASHSAKSSTNWQILLSAEHPDDVMPVHTRTPDPASDTAGGAAAPPVETRTIANGGDSSGGISPAPGSGGTGNASGGTSDVGTGITPRPAGPQTHRVQSGETFSSIAKSFYGDARYFGEIAKANPTVNPTKLKPGTTITLPDKSLVKTEKKETPAATTGTTGAVSAPRPAAPATSIVDAKTEYRVQSTDSLYKISLKLYGTPNKVDAIYQLNKQSIGADPAKLKLNMVLKLPEPPHATASASAAR